MQERTKSLVMGRATPITLVAMILALLAGAVVYFAVSNPVSAGTPVTPNPTLSSSCGVDMVIVVDRSASIDSGELNQMKSAVNSFVDAFVPGTPTEIGVVQFGTQAQVIQNFSGNAGTLHSAINGIQQSGNPAQFTNWAMALNTAQDMFPNRGKPQLIVFASDGNPTARGGYDSITLVTDTGAEAAMLAAAIPEANAAKADGTRIITVGIGAGSGGIEALDTANLEAISSADATITSDFGTLAADLATLADDLCGGTITVHKVIDEDGNIGTTGDQEDGAGWTMNTTVTGGTANPPSGQTDGNGQVNFDINLGGDNTATVKITEALKAGHTFISASCTGGDDNGDPVLNGVDGIKLSSDDIVSCTFYNQPEPEETPSPTPSPTPTPTPSPTPSPTPTPSPSPTPSPTPSPEPTDPPTQAPTPSPTQSSASVTPSPTQAPTASPTVAPATQSPTPAPTSLGGVQTPAALPVSGDAPASANGMSVMLLLFVGMLALAISGGTLAVARNRSR